MVGNCCSVVVIVVVVCFAFHLQNGAFGLAFGVANGLRQARHAAVVLREEAWADAA